MVARLVALALLVAAGCSPSDHEVLAPGDSPGTDGGQSPGGDPDAAIPIGGFREQLLAPDGSLDWDRWLYVAQHFHEEDIVDYRLGPKRADYGDSSVPPKIDQPEPNGLWKAGLDRALDDAFCVTSDKLPKSEAEEAMLYDGGGGWMESGQLLFNPHPSAPGYDLSFRYGSANARAFDGAMARKKDPATGELVTKGLCMRLRAEWQPDWWNRNSISVPATPAVAKAKEQFPDLPLPPVATARGGAQMSVTGFLAFQNGLILAAGTGNDPYTGFGTDEKDRYPYVRLAEGKVPTALAVTPSNELVLATVWDTKARKGQVAVIAVGARNPATVPDGWGVSNWPVASGLKVLGYIDLPFAAPMSISATASKSGANLRGTAVVEEGAKLVTQAQRDAYRAIPWDSTRDEDNFRLLAYTGYAIVASRAEGKVAFIDLKPLFSFYRDMYLTSQDKWDATRVAAQGPDDAQWPPTFAAKPEQTPTLVGTLDVPSPTAVLARQRVHGTNTRAPDSDLQASYRTAAIASLDGTVRLYDVTSLGDPTKTPVVPKEPIAQVKVGENPLQIAQPIAGDGARDDLFVVSRGRAAIHVFDWQLKPIDVLRDPRIVDPVFVAIGGDGAGYGGSGKGYAVYARVLTILDRDGMSLVDVGMATGRRDDFDAVNDEEWPFLDAGGKRVRFQLGYVNPLPGKPFMFSFDEVI